MFNRNALRFLALVFGAASIGFAARGLTAGGGDAGPAVILMTMALICTVAYKKKEK